MKKTMLIMIAMVLFILSTSVYCLTSRRDGYLPASAMAKYTTLGTYFITLIDINENLSIDLYFNRIDYPDTGNYINVSQIVKNDKSNNTKTVLWAEYAHSTSGLTYIPIYDVVLNHNLDKMRVIYQRGNLLCVIDVDLNEDIMKRTAISNAAPIYNARMVPSPTDIRELLKNVTFLAPDIIRISSTKNAAFHLEISDVIVDGENWTNYKLNWWNGNGDIFKNMDYDKSPSYQTGVSELTYPDSSWDDWYHMKRNIIPAYANSPYYAESTSGIYDDEYITCYDEDIWNVWCRSVNTAEDITLTPPNKTLGLGSSFTIVADIIPSNLTNNTVKWVSNNPSIASVNSLGVVTGKSLGTATITAITEMGNKSATCEVTVVNSFTNVTGITLDPTSEDVEVGDTFSITATILPSNASNANVTWSSSDDLIATVDSDGEVTGVSVGTAIITARTADGWKTATCEVNVIPNMVNVKFLKYINNYNTIYEEKNIITGTQVSRPETDPERAGFTFVDWYSNEGRTVLFDFNATINVDTIVYPKWKAVDGKVLITWNDGTVTQDATVNYLSSFTVTVSNTGTPFVYWKDSNDNIRSYDASFVFIASENIELTAVFSDSAVTAEPIVNIDTSNVIKVVASTAGRYNVSFFGDVFVPSGYTVVERGFIGAYSIEDNPKYNNWNTSSFVLGAANMNKIAIQGTSTKIQGNYLSVANGYNYIARTYLTYTDDNGQHTIYSPEIACYIYEPEPANQSSGSGNTSKSGKSNISDSGKMAIDASGVDRGEASVSSLIVDEIDIFRN